MRRVSYPSRGKPSDLTTVWGELVLLLQAAIETANVERWALQRDEAEPPTISGVKRTEAYEVTVVDNFQRLARRYIERNQYSSLWERPLPTGTRGRPKTIDVSLFRESDKKEIRMELGIYDKKKLAEDSEKLVDVIGTALPAGYTVETNLVALWAIRGTPNRDDSAKKWMKTFKTDAASVSCAKFTVEPLMASAVDLFHEAEKDGRYAIVGLFKVTAGSAGTATTGSVAAGSTVPATSSNG